MRILVLESSTTSAKAAYFSSPSVPLEVKTRQFVVPPPDPAVRSAEMIFGQTAELARQLLANRPVDMVALGSTWHGLTLRELDLSSRTPVYEWPFAGAKDLCASLRSNSQWTNAYYTRTGCMVNAIYPAFKALWMIQQGVSTTNTLFMDQGSMNFAFLTGLPWTSHSSASGTGLFSVSRDDWDWDLIEELGLKGITFPALKASTVSAPITSEAAHILGISPGTPVLVPAPDGALNQVGDLAEESGTMTFSMGTSGALRLAVPQPLTSPNLSTWTYRSPSGWLSGAATSGCCNCVDWARNTLFDKEIPFKVIEQNLESGKGELPIFMPFLFGERCPGWNDQRPGGFHEVTGSHNQKDLYKSVLHGVVYNLFQCYQELTAVNGVPKRIRLSGGVLNSSYWRQTTCDVFQKELEISTLQHTSIVGAVRLALKTLGADDRPPSLSDIEGTQLLVPNTHNEQLHQRDYERYSAIYKNTTPEV